MYTKYIYIYIVYVSQVHSLYYVKCTELISTLKQKKCIGVSAPTAGFKVL